LRSASLIRRERVWFCCADSAMQDSINPVCHTNQASDILACEKESRGKKGTNCRTAFSDGSHIETGAHSDVVSGERPDVPIPQAPFP
jgi:hypothetical protein